jgi:hypothetical protein
VLPSGGGESHLGRLDDSVDGLLAGACSADRRWTGHEAFLSRKQKRHPKVAFYLFLVARGGIEPPTQGFSNLRLASWATKAIDVLPPRTDA